MAKRLYATVEQFDSLSAQIGTLLKLAENGNATATTIPPVNGDTVPLGGTVPLANGMPYFVTGLSLGSKTRAIADTLNTLQVGQDFNAPCGSSYMRKRHNALMSGQLSNPGGVRSYRYTWDEANGQGIWTQGVYNGDTFTPTPGGYIFTVGRKVGTKATAHRPVGRAQ